MKNRQRVEWSILGITVISQLLFMILFMLQTKGVVDYARWFEKDGVLRYSTDNYPAGKLLIAAVAVVILFECSVTAWGVYNKSYLASLASAVGMLLYFGMFIQVFYNQGENLKKHILFTVIGVALMWGYYFLVRVKLSESQGKLVMKIIAALIGISLCSLVWGVLTNTSINGSYVWIRIGSFSIQPGEFLKVLIILLSAWVYKYRSNKRMTKLYLVCCAATVCLLVISKDLGNAVVLLTICLVSSWFIFDKWYYTAAAMFAGAAGLWVASKTIGYVRLRFEACFHALESGGGQQYNSLMSIIKNGLWGCGPSGDITSATYITSSATDFTFNAFVAIWGILLAVILLLVLLNVFVQLLVTPVVSPFHYLLGILGVTTIFTQYILHMGGNLNVLPLTGICLNYISAGGSNLFGSFLILGGVLSCMSPGFEPVQLKILGGNSYDQENSRKKMHRFGMHDCPDGVGSLSGIFTTWQKGRRCN